MTTEVTSTFKKASHAVLDSASRETKARHIVELLQEVAGPLADKAVLDIGTGSGHIASYVARYTGSLISVDVVDERLERDFEFRQVESEMLPFEAGSFDVVVSNHAVEHVNDQPAHLREIARVLRPGGVCYMATPNRWRPIEPHFGLPLLSWPPAGVRDRYVRLVGKGERFDVLPLSYGDLHDLAHGADLQCVDLSMSMVRLSLGARGDGKLERLRPAWPVLRHLMPALVVALRKPSRVEGGVEHA